MLQALIYAVLPLIGVVIGAVLHHRLSMASEQLKRQEDLRTQAYVDFLHGVVGFVFAKTNGDENKAKEFDALLANAKARVTIYGSKEVIQTIASFGRGGADIGSPEGMRSFVGICQAMRKDSLPKKQSVLNKEISQLLFEKDLE